MRITSCPSPAFVFRQKRLALVLSALLAPAAVYAAPTGGVVTSGSATVSQAGAVTNINQSTQKATINWQGFSVKPNETVNFNQPNSAAMTLNRVIGNEKSVIEGALNATGKVFLINSNGVLIGKGASVNVGGFVASSLDISDADFNAGNFVFKGRGGSVVNQGDITASGGYVALLGNLVSNEGTITATKGTVALAAGNQVTLNFSGDALVSVTLDEGALNALVENKKAIYADGGKVILTAKAADDLLGAQVNNTGVIQARTLDDLKGGIELYAHGGTTNVDGTLDASAPNGGDGGFIETSGDTVNIANSTSVLTKSTYGANGKWLIDPVDFTIAASGGNITGAALSALLGSNDITIETADGATANGTHLKGSNNGNGDINVNDAVAWSSDFTLTLNAVNNININNAITVNGAGARLVMNYGGDYNIRTKASYAGAVLDAKGSPVANTDTSGGVYGSVTFTNSANTNGLTINGNTYTLIHSLSQLDGLDGVSAVDGSNVTNTSSGSYYALAKDLDAVGTTYTNALVTSFSGVFTGLGHTVSNLTISAPSVYYVGLFGKALDTTTLRDIGLINANITGRSYVGSLLGGTGTSSSSVLANTTISNAYVTKTGNGASTATATDTYYGYVGGLAGIANTIRYAFSDANVSGPSLAGGLVGLVTISANSTNTSFVPSSVLHAHATGMVTNGGGLIGGGDDTTIDYVYATGQVSGGSGLIESLQFNTPTDLSPYAPSVRNSFATGNVVNGHAGLIGTLGSGSSTSYTLGSAKTIVIDNVYATGNITGVSSQDATAGNGVGGLIGNVNLGNYRTTSTVAPSLVLSNSHYSGNITITGVGSYVGGLIGYIQATRTTNGFTTACCGSAATISNSEATGTIDLTGTTGNSIVGGLVGAANQTTFTAVGATVTLKGSSGTGMGGLTGFISASKLSHSYVDATLIGGRSGYVGEIAGNAASNVVITDTYYNADKASSSFGYKGTNVQDGSTGLSGPQAADARYYADGTIGQVLASRAAAAAAAAAAEVAFRQQQEERRDSSTKLASASLSQAQKPLLQPVPVAAESLQSKASSLDKNIIFDDPFGFSAGVKSIEVNGKVYQLDQEGPTKK